MTESVILPPCDPVAAWHAANAHALAGLDANARHSVNLLLAKHTLAPLPALQLQRILDYGAWWDAVWSHYAEVKARIAAGEDARFDPSVPGPCPWSIWQIVEAGA